MANEISLTLAVQVANGGYQRNVQPLAIKINQNTQGEQSGILSVLTTHTDLAFTVGTAGLAFFANLDGTNFVKIGTYASSTFTSFMKLKAGEYAILRLDPAIPLSAEADTATCKVQYVIWND